MPVSGLTTSTFLPAPSRDIRAGRQAVVTERADNSRATAEEQRGAVTIELSSDNDTSEPAQGRVVNSVSSSEGSFFQPQPPIDQLPTDRRNALSLYTETSQLSANNSHGVSVVGVDTLV